MADFAHGPAARVLMAHGLTEPAQRLAGGSGGAWRAAEIVLKRSDVPETWLAWEERVLGAVRTDGLRIQRIRRALGGALVVDGWVARDHLVGDHRPGSWPEIIDAGDAFHAALADLSDEVVLPLPHPRTDGWALADRMAWDELSVPKHVGTDTALRKLLEARRPVESPEQPIHGDLTGNVLFADGLAPGLIDFSPYWRPSGYAIAVVVADAVVWEGADLDLLDRVADRPEMGQCLLRALIFRHLTALLLPGRQPTGEAARRYAELRTAAIALATDPT